MLLAILSLLSLSQPTWAAPFRVVIDPGHGGADYGTIFKGAGGIQNRITEKEITLQLAIEIAAQLRKQSFWVALTREKDQDLPLPARTAFANKNKADVFLSIHLNSAPADSPTPAKLTPGFATFILNNASDESSKRLAHFENTVVSPNPTESGPQNMDVALILKDLRLDANLSESKRLACGIQGALLKGTRSSPDSARNRGVKQALFFVLLGADMPSALVEAGFLNNPRDRALVTTLPGRRGIARAIADSLSQFRKNKNTPQAAAELSRCKVH